MELLLWRWSTAVQITSLVMIAVFFAVLGRSVGRSEVRWWVAAWLANLGALGVTVFYWVAQPPALLDVPLRASYIGAKTGFVVLLLLGAWVHVRPGARVPRPAGVLAAIGAYGVFWGFMLPSVMSVGVVQHSGMGVLFAAGAVFLSRERGKGVTWLAAGCALRAVLSLVEAAAYGVRTSGLAGPPLQELAGVFLSAHSSLDSATEWLLALGCVLALSARDQRELRAANDDLLEAQEGLRRLADRDPLTGLSNRRALPEVLRAVQPQGATLLFFDLNGFKAINDRHGHQVGDECLRRFAAALGESFRPGDALVRYAGDEFLVVASGLEATAAAVRLDGLRERLRRPPPGAPVIAFSVGISELAPGGQPEAAVRAADAAMYAAKPGRIAAAAGDRAS